jgi:hypothetical protein
MTDDQHRQRQRTGEKGEGKEPGHFRQVQPHGNLLLKAMGFCSWLGPSACFILAFLVAIAPI